MWFYVFMFFVVSTNTYSHKSSALVRQWIPLHKYHTEFQQSQTSSPLSFWYSTNCRNFYHNNNIDSLVRENRSQLYVLEAFHPGGRSHHHSGRQAAQEVVVSHEYKFVYVEVRKAASATLRTLIKDVFHVDFSSWCVPRRDCTVFGGRCSSLCLNREQVKDYFFFTFVRNPCDRFLAAYKQFMTKKRKPDISTEGMQRVLENLLFNHTTADEHIQTQSFSLSSSTPDGKQIPLDFIGRVETLDADWKTALDKIQIHSGKSLPHIPPLENKHQRTNEEREQYAAAATPEIMKLATLAYAQDFVCLGYNPEPWIHGHYDI